MSGKCPECGASLAREVRQVSYTYKAQTIAVEQPGDWCPQCGEGVLSPEDMASNRRELHDFRARVDGFLASHEIRRIRKKLMLTQHQAAELFGGGPNAFSRYERGEAMQSQALNQLLRLLDRHPELLKEIKKKQAA